MYIKEELTTQCPKEKGQKDKQRSTNHTHKTKDRVTRTPLKSGGERRYSRVISFCSTSGTCRLNLVTNKNTKIIFEFYNMLLILGHKLWLLNANKL